MDDENATDESQYISSSVGDNEVFSNEENSNQYVESTKNNLELNEAIPETGNTVSSSNELTEKFPNLNQESLDSPGISDSQDNSNSSSIASNKLTPSDDKPAETYKKVKLKRSHILKELCPSVSTSTISTTIKETEIKSHSSLTTENFEDAVSTTSSDIDINEITSNTSSSSPAPHKKVKLIRNNPRFQSNILLKQSVITKIERDITESSETSSTSENVSTSHTFISSLPTDIKSENKESSSPVSVNLESTTDSSKLIEYNKVDSVNDISDVVAQIDQLIGPDDGSINPDSVDLLGSDDLNLSEDVDSTKDLSIIDELENEINSVPSSSREKFSHKELNEGNESSNEVLSKIVEDLSDMCQESESTNYLDKLPTEEISSTNLIDSVLEADDVKETENFENIGHSIVDENFSLVLEDSSDKDDEHDMQIIQSIADENINEYELDLEDKVESVDDLEKKLLEVSAEVENLDSVIEMSNLLQQNSNDSLMHDEVISSEQNDNLENFTENVLLDENILGEVNKTDEMEISNENISTNDQSFETFENDFVLDNETNVQVLETTENDREKVQSSITKQPHTSDFVESLYSKNELPIENSNNDNAMIDENMFTNENPSELEQLNNIPELEINLPSVDRLEEEQKANDTINDYVKEKEETKLPKLTLTIKKSTIKSPKNDVETMSCQLSTEIQEIGNETYHKDDINIANDLKQFQPQSKVGSDHSDQSGNSSIIDDDENTSKDRVCYENTAPKLTIKLINPAAVSDNNVTSTSTEKEIPKLIISTVNSSTEGIPKLTIKTVKKPSIFNEDVDEQPIRKSPIMTENVSVNTEGLPKLIIKPIKKTVEENSQQESRDESNEKHQEIYTKMDIDIKETAVSEISDSKVQEVDNNEPNAEEKLIINDESPPINNDTDVENQQNKTISIVEMDEKTNETSNNQTEQSSSTFSNDIVDMSEIGRYNLSSVNMEIIPTITNQLNVYERNEIDKDDEEIEVIPSSSTKSVPKLSIKTLKKTIQKEAIIENISNELKSIPCSASSKLIIKPVLSSSNPDIAQTTQSLDISVNQKLSQPSPCRVANILKHSPKMMIKSVRNVEDEFGNAGKSHRKNLFVTNTSTSSSMQIQNVDVPEEKSPKSERIVLKINKDNELIKSHLVENPQKITLKISKEGGHPEILHSTPTFTKSTVGQSTSLKRMLSPETTIEPIQVEPKRMKTNIPSVEYACDSPDISINIVKLDTRMTQRMQNISDDVTIERIPSIKDITTPVPSKSAEIVENTSKLKDILMKYNRNKQEPGDVDSSSSDDIKIVEVINTNKTNDKLMISNDESSSQDVMIVDDTPKIIPQPVIKKRGRPRKIPLEVRPELKDVEPIISEVTSPEQPMSDDDANDDTYSIVPKRPYTTRGGRRPYRSRRGRGGRGSRGGRGAYKRKFEENATIISEVSVALDKVDLIQKKQLLKASKGDKISEAVFVEEDTRMSADGEMGEQTANIKPEITDESRSSSTTTENNRNKRGRLEISEIDQHVTGPEQIAEYNWGNGGPYMLQEQVAQYLGVKSFKRKYPGLTRHAVDMQERDYIRENGLASEALCDMGLTAVPSSEILDIMFTDFQDKYEEYRKYQREKQAKDVTNKQRAMASSIATNAEKGGKEESLLSKAVRSAANWNTQLNKTRSEQRRCYLDLQSFTVMYPKGRRPVVKNTNPGNYPVALVPGQFSEHYRKYSSTELKYLPINTVLYGPSVPNRMIMPEIGHSDGSDSDSDSSSGSDSDSSDDSDSTTMDGITTPIVNPSLSTLESDTCKICALNSPKSKPPKSLLIFCAQCNAGIHPRCIDLTPEMMPFIQAYPWQCTDCKTCWQCQAPSDDDKMLFCDRCDRGYHIYCVGLRKVPNGRWHCQQCTATTSTSTTPVPFMTTVQSN